MGRVIDTPLDGGMRGPRGQYRASADNEVLHSENFLHERGRILRNRPATTELDIDVLPTDKVIPFEWNGKPYFFIYDPLYEIDWIMGVTDEVRRRTERVRTPQYDTTAYGSFYDVVALLDDLGFFTVKKNGSEGFNDFFNVLYGDDPKQKGGSSFVGGLGSDGTQVRMSYLIQRLFYEGLNYKRKATDPEDIVVDLLSIYRSYYLLSLVNSIAVPFHIHTDLERKSFTFVNDIKALAPRLTPARLWHRMLVVDGNGNVVGNGCLRAMPQTYKPDYTSGNKFYDEGITFGASFLNISLSFLNERYGLNEASSSDASAKLKEQALNMVETVHSQYLNDVPRRSSLVESFKGEVGGESIRYELTEGLKNIVATDPTGTMPPVVIEGSPEGGHFVMSELSTRYRGTGLRKHYFPSILSKEEFGKYRLWQDNPSPFRRLWQVESRDLDNNVVLRDIRPANLTDAEIAALPNTASESEKVRLGSITFSLWNRIGEQFYNEYFKQYFRKRVVPNTFKEDSLPPEKVGEIPTGLGAEFRNLRKVSNRSQFTSLDSSPVITLRFSAEELKDEDVLNGSNVEATPYCEQFPIVEYEEITPIVREGSEKTKRAVWYAQKGLGDPKIASFFYANRAAFLSEVFEWTVVAESIGTEQVITCEFRPVLGTNEQERDVIEVCFTETKPTTTKYEIGDKVNIVVPHMFDQSISLDADIKEKTVVPKLDLGPDIVSPESYYLDALGTPVMGMSSLYNFKNTVGQSGRFLFTGARDHEEIVCVTSVTDTVSESMGSSTKTTATLGPENGSFSFSVEDRIKATNEKRPLSPYGYGQPLTDEGGIRVFWADTLIGEGVVLGLNKGKLVLEGLDLQSLLNGTIDSSDLPSNVPPLVSRQVTYQVMLDKRQLYILEGSRERLRTTYRSATAPITDFLEGDSIKSVSAMQDTGRLFILTVKGRLYVAQTQPSGDLIWSELTFPQPIASMHRIGQTLYLAPRELNLTPGGALSQPQKILLLRPNEVGDIEAGAKLSLTLKHPGSYRKAEDYKGRNQWETAKYMSGHLTGSFLSGAYTEGEGTPGEVAIGTMLRPKAQSQLRNIFELRFGQVNTQNIRDGLQFDFKGRRIEIDNLNMEVG